MEPLAHADPEVTLKKIDFTTRNMTAARDHGVRGIPYLVLFEGDQQVASGTRQVLAKLGF